MLLLGNQQLYLYTLKSLPMKNGLFILLLFVGFSVFAQEDKAPLRVVVMDKSRKAIVNDKITFTGRKSGKEFVGITDVRGQFLVHLPAGDEYGIKIEVIGSELDHSSFEVPNLPPGSTFNTVTLEIVYELPLSVVLEDLHFKSGGSTIESSSYPMLSEVASYLKRKKDTNICIEGHTDDEGSATANLQLSQKRAEAVRNFLIKEGVPALRITTKGYGETKPIADNTTPEGRAKNRRTEIQIVNKTP